MKYYKHPKDLLDYLGFFGRGLRRVGYWVEDNVLVLEDEPEKTVQTPITQVQRPGKVRPLEKE